ncbi:hypothetical protein DRL22_07305 [Salmonella enterica subsp. enterica serovar Middlesbrough]|nr:hypothetical protein [Salmonella enterica subsp. enterica serovar Middlesbrough]
MPVYSTPDTYDNSFIMPLTPGWDNSVKEGENPAYKDKPSIIGAAFRQNNILAGMVNTAPEFEDVEDYNPFDNADELRGYEQYATAFSDSRSPQQTASIKHKIDTENEDRQFLAESGMAGVIASIAAGVADPVTIGSLFIPGAQGGLVARIGTTATIAAGSTTANEVLLHQQQYTRTAKESALHVASAATLGGMMGAAQHFISPATKQAAQTEISNAISSPSGGSVGAMKLTETTLEQEAMQGSHFANKVMGMTPLGRTMNSPSVAVRRTAQQLAENNLTTVKNLEGIATPTAAETSIRMWGRSEAATVTTADAGYVKFRTQGGTGSKLDFTEEVGKAMRRNDTHTNPAVEETAKALRPVLDGVRNEMQALGLLPEELKVIGAQSYFPRIYRQGEILARRDEFRKTLTDWWSRSGQVASREDLELAAEEVTNKITSALRPQEYANAFSVRMPGATRARTLHIPDDLIEDFLESDVKFVLRQHIRDTAPNIELTRTFGETSMEGAISRIRDDYSDLLLALPEKEAIKGISKAEAEQLSLFKQDMDKIREGKTYFSQDEMNELSRLRSERQKIIDDKLQNMDPKTRKNLNKEQQRLSKLRDRDIADVMAMRDRLLGTYGAPANPASVFIRAGNILRNLNYITKLGGMTASAIPDIARGVMVHGFNRTFRAYGRWLSRSVAWKAGTQDLKKMGVALDTVLSDRSRALADLTDGFAQRSALESGLDVATGKFGNLTLMNQWNSFHKSLNGINTADTILAATKSNARLARLGIDDKMATRIQAQFTKHGETVDGLRVGNSSSWDDAGARAAFESAVVKDVNNTIVTPGVGDIPLWASSPMGKQIFQFKSFIFGSYNRSTIGGMQAGEAQFYYGLGLQIMLGSLTYAIKNTLAGREVDWSPEKLIIEGVDRSGVLGPLMEFNNTLEKVSAGTLGIGPALGTGTQSRYASRNALGSLAGPSFDSLGKLSDITTGILSGDFDDKAINSTRQLIPGQNLFWISPILSKAEEQLKD